jgi:ankyrin repeat domain-containing protein 50
MRPYKVSWKIKQLIECSSAVIDYLVHESYEQEIGIAFIYCNYKEKEDQTAVNLVASLLQQLIQRRPVIPSQLRSLYEQHIRRKTRPTLAECSELLHMELNACSRAFVIVDALDECDETTRTRRDLISQLLRLPPNTHLMVTSREIPSIQLELNRFSRIEIRASDADVRTYLEGRIGREGRLKGHVQADPTLRETILDTIVKKVKGMLVIYTFSRRSSDIYLRPDYITGFFLLSCT